MKLRLGLPVEKWHKLSADSTDDQWSPGHTLLADARKFQSAVRALYVLRPVIHEIDVPRGLHSWEAVPYRDVNEQLTKARKLAAKHHWRAWEARTDDEWYQLARTAAHVAIVHGLVAA